MLKKFKGWRARTPIVVGAVLLTAVIATWMITAVKTDAKWTDALSGLIAFGALCVAAAAWREARRSAEADHRSVGHRGSPGRASAVRVECQFAPERESVRAAEHGYRSGAGRRAQC